LRIISGDPEYFVAVRKMPVEAELVAQEERNENTHRETYGEACHVDGGVHLVLCEISTRDLEIGLEHTRGFLTVFFFYEEFQWNYADDVTKEFSVCPRPSFFVGAIFIEF
jgi:hypothetical protein